MGCSGDLLYVGRKSFYGEPLKEAANLCSLLLGDRIPGVVDDVSESCGEG